MMSNMEVESHNHIQFSEEIRQLNGFHEKSANGNTSTSVLRDMTVDGLLKRMEEVKEDVLAHVNKDFNEMMSEVLQNVEKSPEKEKENLDNADKYSDKRQSCQEGTLPDKVFLQRNSLLTDLFQITHIRTIYNIFLAILILLFFNTVAYDIMDRGMPFIGTSTLLIAFAKFPICFYIWSFMLISTLCVYLAFHFWGHQRLEFTPKSLALKVWDYGWLITFISYQVLFLIFPTKVMIDEDLPLACSIAVLMEQIRLMMKTHAFVRSAAPRFLSYKPHTEVPRPSGPSFSQYLYFLFVPTLVYRDSYPRTKKIRWRVVITNFVEVGLSILCAIFIIERFLMPVFHVFGKEPVGWKWFVKSTLATMIPAMLFFITGFYLLLHAWLNAWAELLRFADRLFYKDWWNCTSYRAYYRTWNVVVHDWLYTYVYKDLYENVTPRNRLLPTFAVFLISAIFHEYILTFTFRFFYPVLFIIFGSFGFVLIFVKRYTGNIFIWLSLCMGIGIVFSLYTIEVYARLNCPPYEYLDFFLPRSWSCNV